MTRIGTDPFGTPARPAREHPDERARAPKARRWARRPGRMGVTVGAVARLATAVAVTTSLVLLVVAPYPPPESRDRREPRWFPISELAGPAASFESSTPDESAPAAALDEYQGLNEQKGHNYVDSPDDDAGDRQHEPGSETPAP